MLDMLGEYWAMERTERRMELRGLWEMNGKRLKWSEDGRVSEVMDAKPAILRRCYGGNM